MVEEYDWSADAVAFFERAVKLDAYWAKRYALPLVLSHKDRKARFHQQLEMGKTHFPYIIYRRMVPKDKRCKNDPVTPTFVPKQSKRSNYGIIREWRRKLHLWLDATFCP